MKRNMKNEIAQVALHMSLKDLATHLDLYAQYYADISRKIDELSVNVSKASHVPAQTADSCLIMLQEICTTGMTNSKETFEGNAVNRIIASCIFVKKSVQCPP